MHVLFVLSGTTIHGGASKSFMNLVNYLISQAVKVTVVCPDNRGVYVVLRNMGIECFSLPYYFAADTLRSDFYSKLKFIPRKIRNYIFNTYSCRKLRLICSRISPDIIHTNSSVIDVGFKVAQKIGIPHIYHIREYGNLDFNLNTRYLDKQLMANNSFSITITKDIAIKKGLLGVRNRVIYNGIVNSDSFYYKSVKMPFFLYAGRIEESKGIGDLIYAYLNYVKSVTSPFQLLIAGIIEDKDRPLVDELKHAVAAEKLDKLVKWLGERDDIYELMRNASATIIPSFNEGFGRVMPEAMANGCLCIARDTAGSKEQLDIGLELLGREIGFRFNTQEELTNQLLFVHNIKITERERVIKDAQTIVSSIYSNENYGKKVMDFYLNIFN